MSMTFEPKHVPSDIIARWPAMALSLWKRSFRQQAIILLAVAFVMKCLPHWSTVVAFLIAPSLFIVSFMTVENADEKSAFSWRELLETTLPGVMKTSRLALKFAIGFGLGIAMLASVSLAVQSAYPATTPQAGVEQMLTAAPFAHAASMPPQTVLGAFLHFCASWTEGVMALVFLGMFVVAIYQGVFGIVLHAQQNIGVSESRMYGWQAWQVNSGSIEAALRDAPAKFWYWLAAIVVAIICSFQTVYLSPVGLIMATYVPSLAYVAYRSIFHGRHQNVPAEARAAPARYGALIPAYA